MTIYKGIEEMLTPNHKLQNEKKASTIQTTFDKLFFNREMNINSQCFYF